MDLGSSNDLEQSPYLKSIDYRLQYIISFPGEGNINPLHYSCLENPMDGGVW